VVRTVKDSRQISLCSRLLRERRLHGVADSLSSRHTRSLVRIPNECASWFLASGFGFARDRIGCGYSAGVGISARISTVGREKKAKGVRVCVREGGSVGERY